MSIPMGIHKSLYIAHRAPVKYGRIRGGRRHGGLTGHPGGPESTDFVFATDALARSVSFVSMSRRVNRERASAEVATELGPLALLVYPVATCRRIFLD